MKMTVITNAVDSLFIILDVAAAAAHVTLDSRPVNLAHRGQLQQLTRRDFKILETVDRVYSLLLKPRPQSPSARFLILT